VEAGLGLEHHRQVLGQVELAGGQQLATEGPHGQLDPRVAPSSADHGPQAITSVSASSVAASQPSRTSTPSLVARRTSSRVTGGWVGSAVGRADDRPEHVVGEQALDVRRIDPLDRHAELLLQRAPLFQRRQPFLGRGQNR
jgi:hypothetical protein